MNPFDIESERNCRVVQRMALHCKSAASEVPKSHVEAIHALPHLTPPVDTLSLKTSPTCIIRPKATKGLASWVPLTSEETPDQDLPPTRKLPLGRYFQDFSDEMDKDDFVLIAPQPVNAKAGARYHLVTREVPQPGAVSQSVTSPVLTASKSLSNASCQFQLSRRDNPLRNPFLVLHDDDVSNERHQNHEPIVFQEDVVVTSTPSTTRSFFQHLTSPPPPCRHESPVNGTNLPERLLLPSL